MFKALISDSTLFIYTLFIWGGGCFLFFLTYLVYILQDSGTATSGPMMWMITIPLWCLVFYTYCEFCFIVIEHGAHGYTEFPVMQSEHFGIFSGPKKLIGVACVCAILWGAYSKVGAPGGQGLLILLYFYLAFFAPAILISVAMQGSAWAGLNPFNAVRTALEIGLLTYALIVFIGSILLVSIHLAFSYSSWVTILYSFVLIWLVNIYVFWLGKLASEHSAELGFVPNVENNSDYQQAIIDARKELAVLAPQIFQFSTKNRLENGLPALDRYVSKYANESLEPVDLWLEIWERTRDWNDWVFLESIVKRLTYNQIKRKLFGDAWQYAHPFFERGEYFPFDSAQDCLALCESGVPIESAKKAQMLTIAAKHFANETVKPHILLTLAKIYYFELSNDKKANNITGYLAAHYPELAVEKPFSQFITLVRGG